MATFAKFWIGSLLAALPGAYLAGGLIGVSALLAGWAAITAIVLWADQ